MHLHGVTPRYLHELHAFGPPLDDAVKGEADGAPSHDAGVEHGPVDQGPVVVHLQKRARTSKIRKLGANETNGRKATRVIT